MTDIVEKLRQVSADKSGEAWCRADGCQDLSIAASLADEAADEIDRLRSLVAGLEEKLHVEYVNRAPDGAEF